MSFQVLVVQMAATFFMIGLIWMVQIVHYPLFDDVGRENYVRYQHRHQNNISFVVGPVMLVELVTAALMIWYPPSQASRSAIYLGFALVVLIWLSTAFLQVPCHAKLVSGFDPEAYRLLVRSNWIRTLAWTARGVLLVWMVLHYQ